MTNETKDQENKGPSRSARLVGIVREDPGVLLFSDEYGVAHARFPVSNHMEVWPCRSSAFTRWLGSQYYKITGGKAVAGRDSISDAIGLLEAQAINEEEEYRLFNRVAEAEGAIWYDLGDPQWRSVRITQEGWEIAVPLNPLFRRFSHLAPQVAPVAGGTVSEILQFVNLTSEWQKVLFLVYLVSLFVPGFPHPALIVSGQQGSAKSSLFRITRKVADPSKIEVVSLTRHENDLVQQLGHHHYLVFDNVSELPSWMADLLCRVITGAGVSKRELWTNDEDVIRNIISCIGINGINIVSSRADLLERSLLLRLERVKKGERKQEQQLMADFEEARPRILGAIFSAVSKAMALRPGIIVDELPRMADFTLWGCAIAEALGIGQDKFLQAYAQNIRSQSVELIGDNTVATLLIAIMDAEKTDKWVGTATQLFVLFQDLALKEKIYDKQLPANPAALMREVNRLKSALEDQGLHVSSSDRVVSIRKVSMNSADVEVGSNSSKALI